MVHHPTVLYVIHQNYLLHLLYLMFNHQITIQVFNLKPILLIFYHELFYHLINLKNNIYILMNNLLSYQSKLTVFLFLIHSTSYIPFVYHLSFQSFVNTLILLSITSIVTCTLKIITYTITCTRRKSITLLIT